MPPREILERLLEDMRRLHGRAAVFNDQYGCGTTEDLCNECDEILGEAESELARFDMYGRIVCDETGKGKEAARWE